MSKKPPKSELTADADDVILSLSGSGKPLDEVSEGILKEPAAIRRELFDVLRDRAKSRKVDLEPLKVVELFSPLVSIPASNKPDFVLKYLRSLFDCTAGLSGKHSEIVSKSLFMILVAGTETDSEKTKVVASIPFDALKSIDSVVSAFDAALSSNDTIDELAKTRKRWMPLVPEIASRTRIPLSQTGAKALVDLLKKDMHELSAGARLSIEPLCNFSGVMNSPINQQSTTKENVASAISTASTPVTISPPEPSPLLPEVKKFSDAIGGFLRQLSHDFEGRLANQTSLIKKLESDRTDFSSQLDLESRNSAVLREEKLKLGEQLQKLKTERDNALNQVSIINVELDKYKAHHGVAITNLETREQDAVSRTKREFIDAQLTTLRSIRDCIAELGKTHGQEKHVRQAVTNFNNFSRYLVHSKYLEPSEISKIEIAIVSSGNAT